MRQAMRTESRFSQARKEERGEAALIIAWSALRSNSVLPPNNTSTSGENVTGHTCTSSTSIDIRLWGWGPLALDILASRPGSSSLSPIVSSLAYCLSAPTSAKLKSWNLTGAVPGVAFRHTAPITKPDLPEDTISVMDAAQSP